MEEASGPSLAGRSISDDMASMMLADGDGGGILGSGMSL